MDNNNETQIKSGGEDKKLLTTRQKQKRQNMLIYPLFFLLFAGSMYLIFAPSGDAEQSVQGSGGFNAELPTPEDETIVEDKRSAYKQEAMRSKEEQKRRNLEDFAFALGKDTDEQSSLNQNLSEDKPSESQHSAKSGGIGFSRHAYQSVNKELSSWYTRSDNKAEDEQNSQLQERIDELEQELADKQQAKSTEQQQLDLIEKSYQIASKYMGKTQGQQAQEQKTEPEQNSTDYDMRSKLNARPVKQIDDNIVSTLSAPLTNEEFAEQYSQARNTGFITAGKKVDMQLGNAIKACVYQTVTLSDGRQVQLRLMEAVKAGNTLIPANTIVTGAVNLSGERMQITISTILYKDILIPVELLVFDTDGVQGIYVPNNQEVSAVKEIASTMGSSAGSSITITDDAVSQLVADLGRSAIQGVSQYAGEKMQQVKITLKSNYRVLLLPKLD